MYSDSAQANTTTDFSLLQADETVETLKILRQFHPSLIGQSGKYVVRLEEAYNVKINFPHNENGDAKSRENLKPDEVQIKGPKKGVAQAKADLLDVSFIQHSDLVRSTLNTLSRLTRSRNQTTLRLSSLYPPARSLEFSVKVVQPSRTSKRTPVLRSTSTSQQTMGNSRKLSYAVTRTPSLRPKPRSWVLLSRCMRRLRTVLLLSKSSTAA
jgi:hypothetical protein